MPDLLSSLQNQDIGHLRIVAELWGLELESSDVDSAGEELAASLLDPKPVSEIIACLSPESRTALTSLVNADGRLPWAAFIRQFGEIREMGAAKRDRERPHLKPASPTEALFYRGLLARAFFDTDKGPQEFVYIPDDLLKSIKHKGRPSTDPSLSSGLRLRAGCEHKGNAEKTLESFVVKKDEPPGREATPAEKAHVVLTDDRVLDEATTLLAALRLGGDISPDPLLFSLLETAKLLKKGAPQTEAVKQFLEAPRPEALKLLSEAWRSSETFNELRLAPHLECEGEWKNQALITREFLLNLLEAIPEGKWWSLAAFVRAVKEKYPDFQRPAGDYDSWFVKRASDGQYLRGFEHWDEVDGRLIRFFITDVLHRLGMADLASPEVGKNITAYRLTIPNPGISNIENGKLHISSQGKITAPRLAPRAVRYQIARFCEREEERPDEYRYRLTPGSLTKAKEQGLKVEHLLALLAKHAEAGIPPVLVKALKRWEVHGSEARAETQVVLKVSRPEVLEELRKSKAARFLGEPLGPTAIVIKSGAQSKVMAALAEMGLLAEDLSTKEHEEK